MSNTRRDSGYPKSEPGLTAASSSGLLLKLSPENHALVRDIFGVQLSKIEHSRVGHHFMTHARLQLWPRDMPSPENSCLSTKFPGSDGEPCGIGGSGVESEVFNPHRFREAHWIRAMRQSSLWTDQRPLEKTYTHAKFAITRSLRRAFVMILLRRLITIEATKQTIVLTSSSANNWIFPFPSESDYPLYHKIR